MIDALAEALVDVWERLELPSGNARWRRSKARHASASPLLEYCILPLI